MSTVTSPAGAAVDVRGPRFSGVTAREPVLGLVAAGVAPAAAFLNAALGVRLGCQLPLVARVRRNSGVLSPT